MDYKGSSLWDAKTDRLYQRVCWTSPFRRRVRRLWKLKQLEREGKIGLRRVLKKGRGRSRGASRVRTRGRTRGRPRKPRKKTTKKRKTAKPRRKRRKVQKRRMTRHRRNVR